MNIKATTLYGQNEDPIETPMCGGNPPPPHGVPIRDQPAHNPGDVDHYICVLGAYRDYLAERLSARDQYYGELPECCDAGVWNQECVEKKRAAFEQAERDAWKRLKERVANCDPDTPEQPGLESGDTGTN